MSTHEASNKHTLPAHCWERRSAFDPAATKSETWHYNFAGQEKAFKVQSTYGKKLDISSIKQRFSFKRELELIGNRQQLYLSQKEFLRVTDCPVCKASIKNSTLAAKVWSAEYRRCLDCSHLYTNQRLTPECMEAFYRTSEFGKEVYMQEDEISMRIAQIYAPKAVWAVKSYAQYFGHQPKSILDLGAGSGHFLKACKDLGLEVSGLEIGDHYKEFSRKHFGIELYDTLEQAQRSGTKHFDIVTSFNVIEHIDYPAEFLESYRKVCGKESLAVIETPKFDSFTISLQRAFPDRIRHYLQPHEHLQLFSENSLATLLVTHGFKPSHYWCFGQDAREFLFHISMESKHDLSAFVNDHFDTLQAPMDQANFSDLMILGAVVE